MAFIGKIRRHDHSRPAPTYPHPPKVGAVLPPGPSRVSSGATSRTRRATGFAERDGRTAGNRGYARAGPWPTIECYGVLRAGHCCWARECPGPCAEGCSYRDRGSYGATESGGDSRTPAMNGVEVWVVPDRTQYFCWCQRLRAASVTSNGLDRLSSGRCTIAACDRAN